MTYTSIVSSTAGILLITFMIYRTVKKPENIGSMWLVPAVLSVLFLAYSIQTIVQEGPLGFWHTHVSSLWGTQIWVDLLIAIGIGWSFIVPKAKALGMRVTPWIFIILATGCIGFLAMVSRMLFLQGKTNMSREFAA